MTALPITAPPISEAEFAGLMAEIGGFESAPLLVVGVSGGADSVALTALADEWARARDGAVIAVTVDHGLRPESSAEAAAVGRMMAELGVTHRVAVWSGPKPDRAVEETARTARYDALLEHCRIAGAPHLLTAHHADDQAETVLLRLCRGSGPDGLAGMAPIRDLGAARLLRPVLSVGRERLRATCRARGLTWLEDPSNLTDRFARGRLRALGGALAGEGLGVASLTATAARAAATRRFMEGALAGFAAAAAQVSPYGFIRLDRARLVAADGELAVRLLARSLATVGGAERGPRRESVERLRREIADAGRSAAGTAARRTLGGCLVAPIGDEGVLICREPSPALTAAMIPLPKRDERMMWDGRFTISCAAEASPGPELHASRRVAALGPGGWRKVGPARRPPEWAIPPAARPSLPALWEGERVVAVADFGLGEASGAVSARFEPRNPLAGPAFPVVSRADDII